MVLLIHNIPVQLVAKVSKFYVFMYEGPLADTTKRESSCSLKWFVRGQKVVQKVKALQFYIAISPGKVDAYYAAIDPGHSKNTLKVMFLHKTKSTSSSLALFGI